MHLCSMSAHCCKEVSELEAAVPVEKKGNNQYLLVKIGEMRYGFDISYVENVIRMKKITRVPGAQPYFKGVLNLRGEIIAVMSLRLKMGLPEDVYSENTRIVILNLKERGCIGLLVDQTEGMAESWSKDETVVLFDIEEVIRESK